jgi:hypothetical protein
LKQNFRHAGGAKALAVTGFPFFYGGSFMAVSFGIDGNGISLESWTLGIEAGSVHWFLSPCHHTDPEWLGFAHRIRAEETFRAALA